MNEGYTKNCPKCGVIQKYSTKKILLAAIKKGTQCSKCCCKKLSTKEKCLRIIKNKKYQKLYAKKNKKKIQEYKKEYNRTHKKEQAEHNLRYYNSKKYKENYKKYLKKYRSKKETQKKIKAYRKEYNQRKQTKENRRLWEKERRKNPKIRLGESVSASIRASLKIKNLSKNGRHWEDIVGYTVQELKEYLESLFQPGMSWNNYGLWHIDHIIPQSFFRYKSTNDVEFKYCWSLNNLQPLWAEENLKKADKLTTIFAKKAG